MKNRVFRILVAVVLVCVLVVNVSPIRVQASALPEVAGVVTKVIPFNPGAGAAAGGAALGAQVFGWVLLGLGIVATTVVTVDLMNRYVEFSGELETSIYYYPDGTWSYGVDISFVERVRAFLFDTGVLADPLLTLSDNGRAVYNSALADYLSLGYDSCYVILAINSTPTSSGYNKASFGQCYPVLENGRYVAYNASGVKVGFQTYTLKESFYDKTVGRTSPWPGVETYIFRSGGAVSTDSTVELGQVAPLEVPMPEAYPEWHTNVRPATNPDTQEEITVLPIPLNPSTDTEELPDGVTQEDVWPGSVVDPLPETDTDTDTGTDTDGSLANTPWETFKKWISEGWKSIIQAIPTPDSIAEAVGNVIKSIFVPDADFISDKWNDIRSRFEFADSITATGEVLVDILDGLDPEPPVIYIDLGATEGSYNIGGEVAFIDLRWYARYKPTMDLIISAFLWLAFVWRLILKLPGIISGMPGEFVLMNLPVNLPHLGIGSGQRREELESGRNNRRLGDGH